MCFQLTILRCFDDGIDTRIHSISVEGERIPPPSLPSNDRQQIDHFLWSEWTIDMLIGIVNALSDQLMPLFIDTTIGTLRRMQPLSMYALNTDCSHLHRLRIQLETIADANDQRYKLSVHECLLRLALIDGSIVDLIRFADRLRLIDDTSVYDRLISCIDATSIDNAIDALWQRNEHRINQSMIATESTVCPTADRSDDVEVKLLLTFKIETNAFIPVRMRVLNRKTTSIAFIDQPNMKIVGISQSPNRYQIVYVDGRRSPITSLCVTVTLPYTSQIYTIRLVLEGYYCRFESICDDNNFVVDESIIDRLLLIAVRLQRASIQIRTTKAIADEEDDVEYLRVCFASATKCWQTMTTTSKLLMLELICGAIYEV